MVTCHTTTVMEARVVGTLHTMGVLILLKGLANMEALILEESHTMEAMTLEGQMSLVTMKDIITEASISTVTLGLVATTDLTDTMEVLAAAMTATPRPRSTPATT